MHELSITTHLLSQVLEQAENKSAREVVDIYLTLGEFSSYVDESINFYWQQIASDSIAKNANIHIKRVSGQAKCLDCKKNVSTKKLPQVCPYCNGYKILVTGGDELELTSIVINK